jgi:hypothetical protein
MPPLREGKSKKAEGKTRRRRAARLSSSIDEKHAPIVSYLLPSAFLLLPSRRALVV